MESRIGIQLRYVYSSAWRFLAFHNTSNLRTGLKDILRLRI